MTILEKRASQCNHNTGTHEQAPKGRARKVGESAESGEAGKQPAQRLGAIADFPKIPATTIQRWAKAGMPVQRDGRFTTANPEELLAWLGDEARLPRPAHIASNTADLMAGLKESIAAAKQRNNSSQ